MKKVTASTLICIALVLTGCSFPGASERALSKRYVSNDYPVNVTPGLSKVALIAVDATIGRHIDLEALSTAFFVQLQSVEGLQVMPVAVPLAAVESQGLVLPRDGLKLADALSIDGVFLAVVTDYNPYGEPSLAIGLTLFSRATSPTSPIDLERVIQGGRPLEMPTSPDTQPVVAVFGVFDASQQTTRRKIQLYAQGQTADAVGLGWERYYRSMPLFMRFVSYEMVWEMFDELEVQRALRMQMKRRR